MIHYSLSITADLRLPRDLSSKQKSDRVDEVIAALGLCDIEHTFIGNARTCGVSGGERKRVSVGVEFGNVSVIDGSLSFGLFYVAQVWSHSIFSGNSYR